MIPLVWLMAAAQTAPPVPPSLVIDKDAFVVRGLGKEVREPIASAPERAQVTYRKDDAFAVWDARGLSVRKGKFSLTTRLPDVALTPKLFTREEIIANRDSIAKGDKKKDASALSGSRRIADEVYFLVRWDDKAGKPWLEALVRVNLTTAKPKPELVGGFDGLSLARGDIEDKLFLLGTSPSAFVVQADGTWGLADFDRLKAEIGFRGMGKGLADAVTLSPRLALVSEHTDYGKVRVARFDLTTGARRDLAELTGDPEFVDATVPALVRVPTNTGLGLRNLDTGAQMNLPDKPALRRTTAGILVWTEGKPETAVLYSPERFLRLASVAKATSSDASQSKPTTKKPPP